MLFRKIFIGICFAVFFIGELSFQIFVNGERILVNLAREERAKLDSVLTKSDVKEEKKKAEIRGISFERSKAVYDTLNQRAMKAKDLFNPYSELIASADKEIDRIWKPYYTLVKQHQDLVKSEYAQRRNDANTFWGKLSGIQFGVSASLMAIMLAFFATLVHTEWKNVLLLCSYIAQLTACTMIYHGAMLQFDNEIQAGILSFMFFACAPLGYHWGTILWTVREVLKVEKPEKEPDKPRTDASFEAYERTKEMNLTHKETVRSIKADLPVQAPMQEVAQQKPIEAKVVQEPEEPRDWVDACQMVVYGKLSWSERMLIERFPKEKLTRYRIRSEMDKIRKSLASPSLSRAEIRNGINQS